MAIEKEVLDQLLAGHDPQDVFGKGGLVDELKKALSERILKAEIDDHLTEESAGGSPCRPPTSPTGAARSWCGLPCTTSRRAGSTVPPGLRYQTTGFHPAFTRHAHICV